MEKIPAWIERLLLPKLNEITGEIKALEARIPVMEKMAEFEVRLADCEAF